MQPHLTHFLNAFLLSVVMIMMLERVAFRVGLVDYPTERKAHGRHVPLVGGLAIFMSFLVASFLAEEAQRAPWNFIVGAGALVMLGALDDILDIPALIKLMVQIIAASIIIIPGWHLIGSLGDLFGQGSVHLGPAALPFTLVFMVGLINAFNMLDGVDGVAGGAAACAFFWLAVMASSGDQVGITVPLLLLLSATLGFLTFNMRHPWCQRARVFMGDAGSTMLGAAIAFFTISLNSRSTGEISLPALLWLFAVPALDTLSLIVRRIWAGRSPFSADRDHLHHLFLESGATPGQASAIVVALCALHGAIGTAGAVLGVPDSLLVWGLLVPAALHTLFVLWRSAERSTAALVRMPALDTSAPSNGRRP
ncbi:MraY family glycosyltransferase [Microvirga pakistanensis]|uniref:MraY family glycosyltransferase n=1 Tax=Microvirga pakistanensis TaxID=1682650 RepID=UPI00141BEFDA|nr:MraY family glycosyltransferase [Microvirga pakistanensis]